MLPYEVTVTTGDVLNAGTDADVFLQLYGEDGKSQEIKLRNRTDNFERKAVDKFKVGEIFKVFVFGAYILYDNGVGFARNNYNLEVAICFSDNVFC